MLAGVESMRRHRDILLRQKNLSARQARWIEKISEFNFDVEYLPGPLNVLPDALSRMYSNDAPGTLRLASFAASLPVFVDVEARAVHDQLPVPSTAATPPYPRRSPRQLPTTNPRWHHSENPVRETIPKRIGKLVIHGPRAQRVEGGSEGSISRML